MQLALMRIVTRAAVVVAIVSGVAWAQAPGGPGGPRRGCMGPGGCMGPEDCQGLPKRHLGGLPPDRARRLIDHLGLDDAARAKLLSIIDKARPEDERLRRATDQAEVRLRDALGAATADRKSVLSLAQRLGSLRTKLHQLHLGLRVDIGQALAADKREAWRNLVDRPPPPPGRAGGPGAGRGRPRGKASGGGGPPFR